jgi:hypothetical protein
VLGSIPETGEPGPAGAVWRYRIGIADAHDREAIGQLRRAAFRRATEFNWLDEAMLDWSVDDDASTVIALSDRSGTPLSTVRATVFGELHEAERFLEYSLAGMPIALPTLVNSRAATAPEHARHGLLALVRYACLSAAATSPVRSVITIVYEGAPRLAMMREAGYQFIKPRESWDSEAVAHTQPLLALLPHERLAGAVRCFGAMLARQLDEVQINLEAIADGIRSQGVVR